MIGSTVPVRWGGYINHLCNGYAGLQQQAEFVDMTLAADSHHVQVHQTVVALASPYLKELIKCVPNKHPVIFLNGVSSDELCYILEYIYTGEVDVPEDKLNGFLKSAKALHILGIENTSSNTINELENTNLKSQILSNIGKPANNESQYQINIQLDNATQAITDQNNSIPIADSSKTIAIEVYPSSAETRPENTFNSTKDLLDCLNDFEGHQMDIEETVIESENKDSPLDFDKLFQVQNLKDSTNAQYSLTLPTKAEMYNAWTTQDNKPKVCIELIQEQPELNLLPETMSNVNSDVENNMQVKIRSLSNNQQRTETAVDINALCDDDIKDSCVLQYSISNKGALQMILNRFMYYVHNMMSKNRRRWRCIDYRSKKCLAVIDTDGELIIQRTNAHSHPFHDKKILEKVRKKLVFTCLSTALNYAEKRNS